VAHAIAPDARLVYVNLESFARAGASAAGQFEQAFSTVATRYPGAIWSISLGQCEYLFSPTDLRAVDGAVKHAEQSGTTVFAASGDSAGLECLGIHDKVPEIPAVGISFPGDLPHVTSVGGTALDLSTSGRYLLETSWTEPMLSLGSTGGQSSIFARPGWQQAPGVVGPYSDGAICGLPAGATCREVPDVSADADPSTGAAVRVNGKWLADGGTSLATPVWAAFMALVDQYLGSRGQPPAGFLNPLLYRLARATPAFPTFHDVTLGANDVYLAGVGYDMVTGLGTSRVWNLARDLAAIPGRS
jgi:kumamolisin